MREILFRGKAVNRDPNRRYRTNYKNGDWVYGLLTNQKNYNGFAQMTNTDGVVGIDVDPETVGQYTGLTDTDGKKIFEGDIVEGGFTRMHCLVCFGEYTYINEYEQEESACGWYDEEENGYISAFGCPGDWATVIGNIHDNPELMKGERTE